MEIVVRAARKAEAPILDNMMQMYLHDFSEFTHEKLGDDGRFDYPYLSHYWEDPNRYPFIVIAEDEIAGFALTRFLADPATGEQAMEMAEFFVMRGYRRFGIGSVMARKLWDLFPGNWELRVMSANKAGSAFWKPLIADYTENRFTESPEGSIANRVYCYRFASNSEFDPPDDLEMDFVD